MFKSTFKKTGFVFIGLALVIGLGYLGWQRKQPIKAVLGTVTSCTFTDVPTTHPDQLNILATCLADVMSAYTTGIFNPDHTVSNSDLAIYLTKAMNGSIPKSTFDTKPHFCEVTDYKTSLFSALDYLYGKNVVLCPTPRLCRNSLLRPIYWTNPNGKPIWLSACSFDKTAAAHREDAATWIARALAGGDANVPAASGTPVFSDISSRSSYKYIQYLGRMGVAVGYPDGTFHPTEHITRAHLASFLAKGFDLISKKLVSNVSGTVTTTSGVLANGYIVIDDGEDIVQTDAYGKYTAPGLDATTHELAFYDSAGNLYENPDPGVHLISPNYGPNTINFSGLVRK